MEQFSAAAFQERTLRTLEFTKIREQLAAYAQTEMGKEACLALLPSSDPAEVTYHQQETEEATVVLSAIGGTPLSAFPDVRGHLTVCEKGGTLSPGALLSVAEVLRCARAARSSLVGERENTPILRQLADGLVSMRNLEEDITSSILSEDEIADRASSALADIRRHLRGATDRIKDKLNAMIHHPNMAKYLQDAIVTVRNDRYVIPVRAEYRSAVPGLVHDQSSSGATLFIEPMAAVEMGNEIRQWLLKEQQEIARILASLSASIAPYADQIGETVVTLGTLDFIFAKGQLSRAMSGVIPKLNREGFIHLIRARHPLIPRDKVVPSTLWMGREFTTLVITGPNTGGKTVTLKTVGLLTLMAQAGLHVPADLGTELAIFGQVFADIGDEQSIEQSLSTFSGHMTNIVLILREVTSHDLVLFDELGAGTDPTEGAALAQTILQHLLDQGIRTLATTHYSELKAFALSTSGVENASVEFDVETLRPTYRLSIGVPGKSNAFEISRKLGLSEGLIQGAKALLSSDTIRLEDVIANAEYHRLVAERERQLAADAAKETTRLRDEAEELRKEMEEKRTTVLRKAKEEARRTLEGARRDAESLISDLKRLRKQAADPAQEAAALRRKLEQSIDQLTEGIVQPLEHQLPPPKDLRPGDKVDILTLGSQGVVLSPPDSKGEVAIQAGIVKLKVHLTQLRLVREKPPEKKTSLHAHTGQMARTVPMSVDVRGKNLEEAVDAVDIYLDEAVLASLGEVTIIHGKGSGILRSGITQHLRRHPHVKSARLGKYGEGEDGVTVVTLK